ncbi:DUF2029 domain-containing protein [bacterium]|nr:DUF2029 domain-containing protein [bacterium]
MKKILILAFLLYLLIAPFTFHPDTKLVLFYPSIVKTTTLNIYQYLENHPNNWPPFHYPPLNFVFLKIHFFLSSLLGGKEFISWLSTGADIAPTHPQIFRFNLAAKYPFLILTLAASWLIYLIAKKYVDKTRAKLAAIIWLFNPITLYSVVAMGQNDIVAIFFFLLGLLFYKKRAKLSFFFFGIAGSIKTFPLIWALVAANSYPTPRIKEKIKLFLISLTTYLITIIPFVGSIYFRNNVLFSGLSMRMFVSSINLGFEESILLAPALITLLLFLKSEKEDSMISLNKKLLAVNLLILGFSHFHPQWSLWTVPFFSLLIPTIKESKKYTNLFFVFTVAVFLLIVVYKDIFLQIGIFSPLNPSLLNLPPIYQLLSDKLLLDVNLIRNLSHSLITGISLYSLLLLTQKDQIGAKTFNIDERVKIFSKRKLKVISTSLFLLLLFPISQFLPVIKKETAITNTEKIKYLPLKEAEELLYEQEVSSSNFYRVDVLLKNPGLKSKDKFEITIFKIDSQNQASLVALKQVSAFNIGDPGYIRIDLPPHQVQKGKKIMVTIKPTKIKDGKLKLAVIEKGDQKIPVINLFYKPDFSIKSSVEKGISALIKNFRNQPEVFLLPLVLATF